MKKLINRFLGVVVAVALLMGTVMPNVAVMADSSHAHHAGENTLEGPSDGYTITLTKPKNYDIKEKNAAFGAYQIFTGNVEGKKYVNPGANNEKIPLTDIRWGNAFGKVDSPDWQSNIVKFVYALATPPTSGDYASAFKNFNGFDGNNGDTGLRYESFAGKDTNTLAERFYKDSDNNGAIDASEIKDSNVNFDKLAAEVANVIEAHKNREWLQAFTDILGGYGAGYKNGFVNQCYDTNGKWEKSEYKIKVPAGYYMVLDMTEIDSDTEVNESYSARMLFVANNITQVLKEDVPKLDKKIVRDGGEHITEVAGVGDEVEFQLKGSLPSNYDNYTLGYKYIFEDTLSAGLTLNEKSAGTYVEVTVEGVYDENGTWSNTKKTILKTSCYNKSGIHTHGSIDAAYKEEYVDNILTVTFPCLKEIEIIEGTHTYTLGYEDSENYSKIYVNYTATINDKAVVSSEKDGQLNGNTNTAKLTYSDNPQNYEDTDTTTTHEATVYVFGLDIIKVDAAKFLDNDKNAAKSFLEGAQFVLVRPKAGTDGDDTEWEIAQFSDVNKATIDTMDPKPNFPTSFNENGYSEIVLWKTIVDADNQPVKNSTFNSEWFEVSTQMYTEKPYIIISGTNGVINVSGLDVGVKYTMVETKTPGEDGKYAKIKPFDIELAAATKTGGEYNGSLSSATSTQNANGSTFSLDHYVEITDSTTKNPDDNGSAGMLVANFEYENLPSTGGIGIYPFYIIGGIVVAGSIILFALSRRKKTA